MVRNYKRKTNRQSWSEQGMREAIRLVRSGEMGYEKAASSCKVPLATLYRRCKTNKDIPDAAKKSLGHFKTVFNENQENELVRYLLDMERRLFGLSFLDFRSVVFQFATKNNIINNFNNEVALAGRDWVYNFLKRHPQISLRRPENTSAARAAAFNKPNVNMFFDLLGQLMDKYKFPPSRIFNCDETGITTVPNKPGKVLSLKGKKQIGVLTSGERGTLVTAEICFSASGQYIPPLLVFPRVRRNPQLEVGLPTESISEFHPSGWMQSHIFAPTWIKHFIKYAKPSAEDPVLLVLDGHATHTKNIKLLDIAKENHIHILVIPPHTSHRLQPLDVGFMAPLSIYYEQEVKCWLRNNPGKVVTLYEVGKLFGTAFQRAATVQNAISAFKNTGICPFNPHVFPEELFCPAETTNQTLRQVQNQNIPVSSERHRTSSPQQLAETLPAQENNGSPQPGCSKDSSPPDYSNDSPPPGCSKDFSPPGYSNDSPQPGCSNNSPQPGRSEDTLHPGFSKDKTPPRLTQEPNNQYFSPYDIVPLPKASPKLRKNCRRGRSMILTSTPNIEEIKQTAAEKSSVKSDQVRKRVNLDTKSIRKAKRTRQDYESDSSQSSISVENLYDDSSDFDESDNEVISKQTKLTSEKVQLNQLKTQDFVLVELNEAKRNTKKIFVSQVITEVNEEGTIKVKFMRAYRQSTNIFVFPDADDESIIYEHEVVGKLKKVEHLRYGKIKFC